MIAALGYGAYRLSRTAEKPAPTLPLPSPEESVAVRCAREGGALLEKGDYAGAERVYTAGLKASPQEASLYALRANIALFIGPREKGLADARKARKLAPELEVSPLIGILEAPKFEPIVPARIRLGRRVLASIAAAQLQHFRSERSWAATLPKLLGADKNGQELRRDIELSFEPKSVRFMKKGAGLVITARPKGIHRTLTAQGDTARFDIPEIRWEHGSFPPVEISRRR